MREKSAASCVLEICLSRGKRFSLRDVVARVHEQHPELTDEFPTIWGQLVRRKKVRVCYSEETLLYEVVGSSHGHHPPRHAPADH